MNTKHSANTTIVNDEPKRPVGGQQRVGRVVKNSAFGVIARVLDALMRFVVLAMIVRYLGPVSFGNFSYITAIAALVLSFGDFGLEPIMVREMSNTKLQREPILGSVLFLRLLFCVLLFITVLLFVSLQDLNRQVAIALLLETVAQFFVIFQITFIGVFRTYEKIEYDFISSLIYQGIMFLSIGAVIFLDLGFIWIFIARILTEFTKLVVQFFLVQRKFIKITLNVDVMRCLFLLKEAIPVILLSFMFIASQKINILFLKYFQTQVEISYFDIPQRLLMMISLVPMMIIMAVFPILCRQAKSSKAEFIFTYQNTLKFITIIGVAVSVFLFVWASDIIVLLFGAEFLPSALVLQILSVAICFQFWVGLMNFTLTAVNKQTMPIFGAWVGMAVNCIAAFFLIPNFAHIGAAVSMLLGSISFFVVNQWMIAKYVRHIKILPILYKPILCAAVTLFLSLPFKNKGVFWMLLGVIVGLGTFVITLYVLKVYNSNEIQTFSTMLRRRRVKPPF